MKAENIRILRAFAKYILELEHNVEVLVPHLRDFDVINGSESDRILKAPDRSSSCKILLLDILPNKDDSALSQLKEAMSCQWIEPAKYLQQLMEKGVTVEEAQSLPNCVPVFSKVPDARTVLKQNWNSGTGHRNKIFTGRKAILEQLSQALAKPDCSKETSAVCLSGTGGIGKSTIALQFCHQSEEDFSFLAWIRADSAERLVEELQSLGGILGIPQAPGSNSSPETLKTLKALLAANPGWLLVLDDLSEDAFKILKESIPNSGGSILITSRLRITADWITRIEVPELPESAELLGKVIGSIKPADFEDVKEWLASEALGGLPLAIMHAGSYIQRSGCSIANYLERFKNSAAILNKSLRGVEFQGSQQVLTTWDLTMDLLRKDSEDTFRYLGICSFLANEIEDGFMNSAPIFQLSSELETKERVEDAKNLLLSFSLLSSMEAGVKIHALVQEAVIFRSSIEEKLTSFANAAAILDKNNDHELNLVRLRSLFGHSESMLIKFHLNFAKIISQNASSVQESNYELVVGVILWTIRRLRIKLSDNCLVAVFETSSALFGVDSKEMREIFRDVGLAFGVNGNYDKERECLEKALKLYEDLYGHNHFEVAIILHNLGVCVYELGHLRKAIELFERSLEIYQNFYDTKQGEIADTLGYLGFCYGRLGDHQREKEILEKAREIMESLYAPDHINLAPILSSLGHCYESFGDFQKMMQMHEASLKINEDFYGKDHVEVAVSLVNISNFYGCTGDHDREKELLERALSIYQDFYGDINHSLSIVLNNVGNCHSKLGDYHRAKDMLEKALKMEQLLFGENHFEVASTLNNLALCFGRLGDEKTKSEMLERALEIEESFYGENHEDVASTLLNLGVCYCSLNKYTQSIACLKRALEILKSGFNVEHLFHCYHQMSETLLQISKEYNSSETEKNLQEAQLNLEKARTILQENIDDPRLNGWLDEVEEKQREVDNLIIESSGSS